MATVEHSFNLGQTVFNVNETQGVREAVVRSIDITINQTGTLVRYGIVYNKSSVSDDVYQSALYGDIDSALAVYKNMVLVP